MFWASEGGVGVGDVGFIGSIAHDGLDLGDYNPPPEIIAPALVLRLDTMCSARSAQELQ